MIKILFSAPEPEPVKHGIFHIQECQFMGDPLLPLGPFQEVAEAAVPPGQQNRSGGRHQEEEHPDL